MLRLVTWLLILCYFGLVSYKLIHGANAPVYPMPMPGAPGPGYGAGMGYGVTKYPLKIVGGMNSPMGVMSPAPECVNLTAAECEMRQTKCEDVSKLMQGSSGPVKDIFTCATALSIPKTSIVGVLGDAFKSGHPETIVDKITNDTAMGYHLRRCVLMQNGMLGMNDTINRAMMFSTIQASFGWNPPLAQTIITATQSCEEPVDLKYSALLDCIRMECVKKLPMASFAYKDPDEEDEDDEDD